MATASASLIPHIHHERQEEGSMLCAQHALNALLQGNYYDPSQLADLARQLDDLEKSQLDEEAWRSRDVASLNMDDTGYFSVSVLEKALEVWGLSLLRWRSEEMRPFQSRPEEQLAFVLNLDSHWFTIRGFLGGYWYNLNSFLPQPSWVGPSYLGALLNAAETEGYSVFVVRAQDDSRGIFQSSLADECAATLPNASVAGGQGSETLDSTVSAQGLRPSIASKSPSTSASIKEGGLEDEEADIQAALRASMAGADLGSGGSGSASSRMHSPLVVGQRRFRGGNIGEEDSYEDEEETDAHVDAIAPSRRRARGMGPGEGSNLVSSRGLGVPYVLPSASGGRRRTSRLQTEEEERNTTMRRIQRAMRRPSGSHQHPIALDDDDEGEDDLEVLGATRTGNEEEDDEVDDLEGLDMATSTPRSPFLNPVLMNLAGGSGSNSDDDFHSISSGEGNLDESRVAADAAVLRRQALMSDRSYDDEDAQLQAALAASIRDAEAGEETIPSTANWISEEDSKAIREAQTASWTSTIVRQDSSETRPPPTDVARIAKMRAEAKQKEEDERLGITRDESMNVSEGGVDDEESDEEDGEPQMTAEEMRKARLARFGS
ncbi:hypothetical protein CBS101457_001117 [Exobasidium rhododendri]|nr:hypothetical protein CBS101457_001117 [Exobasidium rhododendri]